MKVKSLLLLTIAVTLCLSIFVVSASTEGYLTDSLVGFFDGSNNQGDKHDKDSETWKDLSGKGNDITVVLDENNKWNDNGYFNDSTKVRLPDAFKDVVNGDEFTVEIVMNNIDMKGLHYNTVMNCDNDAFALFRRESDEIIMFKNGSNPRPQSAGNTAPGFLGSKVTLTVTLKLGEEVALYINGEKIDAKDAPANLGANSMFFGHDSPDKNYSADYEFIRFYNRELTADEIAKNYAQDVKEPENPSTDVSIAFLFYTIAVLGLAGVAYKASKRKVEG